MSCQAHTHCADMRPLTAKGPSWGKWIVLFIVFAALVAGIVICFDIRLHALRLFDWIEGLGPWAPALFIVLEMLVVILVLPGVVFTLGAGFMFGVMRGSLYVLIGETIGATVAFLMARYFLGQRFSGFLLAHSKLNRIDDELSREGWKIVLLTRLVPFFPFKLTNYVFGLMQISLHEFVIGVFFGIMPLTINNVYIGSLAADLATLGSRGHAKSPAQWIVYGLGFVATVLLVVHLGRLARKTLEGYTSRREST